MKKRVWIVVLCLLIVGVVISITHIQLVGADSGFDSSYDSGFDSSYDSGWDSSYSGSSSSGGSSDPRGGIIVIFSLCALVIYYVLAEKVFKFKNINKLPIWYKIIYKSLIFLIVYFFFELNYLIASLIFYVIIKIVMKLINKKLKEFPMSIERETIEGLDNKKIINDAFENYKELQIAWMNFDYKKIKELVSDEMYNMYVNQLEILKIKNQQNIMSDIEFIEGYIIGYKKINNKEVFEISLKVSCYDYIINTTNNKTVRGNKNRKLTLIYLLTFERSTEIVKYCPQCGADINNLTECKYCKSKIVNNSDKLKMTKKQIIIKQK